MVPDDAVVRNITGGFEVRVPGPIGPVVLMSETFRYSPYSGEHCVRHWFDGQGVLHRPEQDGPAIQDDYFWKYFKHGKVHRNRGPAFFTALKENRYFIEGLEIPHQAWATLIGK